MVSVLWSMAEVASDEMVHINKQFQSLLCWLTFIQDQELAISHHSSGQCNYLTLTDRQVVTTACDFAIQSKARFVLLILESE